MALELSTHSIPRRPRAATSVLPTMVPPLPSRRTRGASTASVSPVHYMATPQLETGDPGIPSTAQEPLRHPKPLTPSDLHLVLEKEQEAIVNRLTRELSLLRQQTTSVTSTTSSASNLTESDGLHVSPSLSSSTTSHVSRRQRSSSSLSSHTPAAQGAQTASVTGIAPSRDTSHPSRPPDHSVPRKVHSREPSVTSRRPSTGSLSSFPQYHGDQLSHYGSTSIYPHRDSVSQSHGLSNNSNSLSRYEEATIHKSELESMKRENEQLRKRVRELENTLKKQKEAESS